MLHTHRYRHIAALFLAAAALAACTAETESPAVEPNVPSVAALVEEAPSSAAPAALQEQQDAVPQAAPEWFDVGGLPVSTAPLGTHPYFSIPEGHRGNPRKTFHAEFASAAFWTGDRFEVIEGPVYATGIRRAGGGGPSFSALQVAGELEQAITAAGGVKIFDGQVPPGAREDEAMTRVMEPYDTEAKCWAHDPVRIYVIRRDDREIWIRSCLNRRFAGLIVAETGTLESTVKLLEADRLKRDLDTHGKVAVQVNFATDSADILPDSEPQISQVVELLVGNPDLRLSIEGHTDDSGSAAYNLELSEARAAAVAAALTRQGVDPARLQSRGFGHQQPVADNATDAGRAANRRVELVRL